MRWPEVPYSMWGPRLSGSLAAASPQFLGVKSDQLLRRLHHFEHRTARWAFADRLGCPLRPLVLTAPVRSASSLLGTSQGQNPATAGGRKLWVLAVHREAYLTRQRPPAPKQAQPRDPSSRVNCILTGNDLLSLGERCMLTVRT
jgi:hypothetical protein